ncbi:hypothetical protein WN51_04093 [Melipona quadrifasciata]|uniref:Uncharacterized protein n=1 Tax=Melipona quadrifasciata TaxID=166423 RepID=A0A0M8ZQ26_9HYME|nr:hypothetical protein WN51_04093 [Melipona quadrifasciata]
MKFQSMLTDILIFSTLKGYKLFNLELNVCKDFGKYQADYNCFEQTFLQFEKQWFLDVKQNKENMQSTKTFNAMFAHVVLKYRDFPRYMKVGDNVAKSFAANKYTRLLEYVIRRKKSEVFESGYLDKQVPGSATESLVCIALENGCEPRSKQRYWKFITYFPISIWNVFSPENLGHMATLSSKQETNKALDRGLMHGANFPEHNQKPESPIKIQISEFWYLRPNLPDNLVCLICQTDNIKFRNVLSLYHNNSLLGYDGAFANNSRNKRYFEEQKTHRRRNQNKRVDTERLFMSSENRFWCFGPRSGVSDGTVKSRKDEGFLSF